MPFRNREKELSREIIPLIDFPCERNWVVTYFPPPSPCYTTSTNRGRMQKNVALPLLPPQKRCILLQKSFRISRKRRERATLPRGFLPSSYNCNANLARNKVAPVQVQRETSIRSPREGWRRPFKIQLFRFVGRTKQRGEGANNKAFLKV